MIKTLLQIIFFLLALLYIGARIGMHSNQIRNARTRNYEPSPRISKVPDSIWIAQEYTRTVACDTLGQVMIELELIDRASGWVKATQSRKDEGKICSFTSNIHLEWLPDYIKVQLPLGAVDAEARCPLKCRYYTPFRTKMEPVYVDTTIEGNSYKLLQITGFEVAKL